MIRALIVDDQEDMRFLIRFLCDRTSDGLEVVGEAAGGSEALALLPSLDPDVVVIDQMMPGMDGLELAERIRAAHPTVLLVLCTAYIDPDVERRAAAIGFVGVIPKDEVARVPDLVLDLIA